MEKEDIKKKFNRIFWNKGNIGPIAEKARRNFELIHKNEINRTGRVYHFCVAHAFKNLDKSVFESEFNEEKETLAPTKFLKLQKENFTFENELLRLLESIRNLNSHYVHTFDCLEVSKINVQLVSFIKEAFHFSVLINYLKENSIGYEDFKSSDANVLIDYLRDKFFPNKEQQKKEREYFSNLNLNEALDELLFIEVEEEFDWFINDEHNIFPIEKGKYLSFFAQLFLISLFLYKQEAEQLISKIKGFKRNEDKFHYKRDIFTLFSKKVSSQDIDNEEKYLIRFRDIIQYLNKYPVEWKKHLELKSDFPEMTNDLERHIIETEIFRSFPTYANSELREKFLEYAVVKLFPQKTNLFNFESIKNNQKDEGKFGYEINTSPELKDKYQKLSELRDASRKITYQIKKLQDEIRKKKEEENPVLSKLKKRIAEDKLIPSYGRNQDRFMQIAIRFLAEENYFGKDVLFKAHQFYTTDEQTEYLTIQKKILSKKEYDKLKYHQGKLVHFTTFENHLQNYPNWDTPFVIENNAFQIKLKLKNGKYQLFSIQRALLPYLLEDILYNKIDSDKPNLLISYFDNSLIKDFEKVTKDAVNESEITTLHRKLLPSRYLQSFNDKITSDQSLENPFIKYLEEANQHEEKYKLLLSKAETLNLKEEFVKKNKGKQFKLRFIKKAWHLMYFREIYEKQFAENGHHKGFHITKEEFNDFSKWMFAFEDVSQYKSYLKRLFQSKQFFTNKEFENLFESGNSLEDLYLKTKEKFKAWLQNSKFDKLNRENDYSIILKKEIVYINLSHFIEYLKQEGRLRLDINQQFQFKSQENIQHLISPWYYIDVLPKEEYKTNAKLFNKLRKIKLEDALLYEIAIKYLQTDESIAKSAKNSVDTILNSDIVFEVKDPNNEKLYNLVVPFNKLETLAILIQHKTEQLDKPQNHKTSFLTNLFNFLNSTLRQEKEIESIAKQFKEKKELSFEDLNKINNHIITTSIKFSEVHIELERYFILKHQIKVTKENRIDIDEFRNDDNSKIFNFYYERDRVREKAFHFGVPIKPYKDVLDEVENKFLKEEVRVHNFSSFQEIDINKRLVCSVFMNILHNDLYKQNKEKDNDLLRKEFEDRYFDECIVN